MTIVQEADATFDAPAHGEYAKALSLSRRYLVAATAFFAIPPAPTDALADALNIGYAGREGLGV